MDGASLGEEKACLDCLIIKNQPKMGLERTRRIIHYILWQHPNDHVFILPHAEEYRVLYSIPLDQVLTTLNTPDTHEGLTTGRYTAEKAFGTHRVYVYYYRTLPLRGKGDEVYAIVDFIGYSEA